MIDPVSVVKTIRIIVADDFGNILATSDRGGDVSVVSFKYKFDDEDPDECSIKLQTADPLSFDKIGIGRSTRLQVAWGYINGPMTLAATVVVRDLQTKYGHAVITTELICSDLLFYTQTARATDAGNVSIIEHLLAQFVSRYNIVIKDAGNVIWSIGLGFEDKGRNIIAFSFEDYTPIDPYSWAIYSYQNLLRTSEFLSTYQGPGFLHVSEDNPVWVWLNKSRGVVNSNRSQMIVIRDLLKEGPNGPWYVTGRGQTLLIHNRDFVNKPVRSYLYQDEPSTLIDFTAKTKYDQFEKNSVTHGFDDPANKVFYSLDSYLDELFSMVTFQEKFEDKSVSEKEFTAWLKSWIDLMKAYEKWHSTRIGFSIYGNDVKLVGNVHIIDSSNDMFFNQKDPYNPVVLNDNTNVKYPSPYFSDVVLRGFIYSRPLQFMEDRDNFVSNEMRKMEMEKEEAKFIVVGDPFLQSQMRVYIGNVHWQHKGTYYIKKCEHILSKQGYKTTLDCIKILATNRLRVGETKQTLKVLEGEDKPRVEVEKQFAKEKKLFGDPIMLKITKQVQVGGFPTSYGTSVGYFRTIPVTGRATNIKEEMTRENFIQFINELRGGGGGSIESNIENN